MVNHSDYADHELSMAFYSTYASRVLRRAAAKRGRAKIRGTICGALMAGIRERRRPLLDKSIK